jgi:hypothetical protein
MSKEFFVLWHDYVDEWGCDQEKLLGIYSTREKAEEGLALLRDQPGFRDYPDGFEISHGTMDETYMREGFVSVWGDEEPVKDTRPRD